MKLKQLLIIPVALTSITMLSGLLLSSIVINATENNSGTDSVSVTVDSACTMTGGTSGESTANNTFTASINPGNYTEINGSKLVTICNDSLGYSIYAIGYSGDSYDSNTHTDMIGANNIGNISTGTTGNSSYWAMKLQAVQGTTPPTISDGTGGTENFTDYHVIPASYTQIAKYASSTASSSSAGAQVQTKYKVNISSSQAAGSYTGKVKYTMVHPNNADAPVPPPSPAASCNTPVPNYTYMQDINSTNKTAVLASLEEGDAYYLRDNRDEEPYCVSKLADGNLWMIDNLRLDITDSAVLNSLSTANTHAGSASLISLKEGNRANGNQYATGSLGNLTEGDSYSVARANSQYKNTIASDVTKNYGIGSHKYGVYYNFCAASAGSYCFGNGSSQGTSYADAQYDLCPVNWRMPTSGPSGEYNNLYTNGYSSDITRFKNALSMSPAGEFYGGSAFGQGQISQFWSSTRFDNYSMYDSGSSYPSNYHARYYGYSLRCLLGA